MNRTQAHWALLKASSVICAVLFVLICVSILDTRPNTQLSDVPKFAYNVVKRVPASLPRLLKEKPHAIAPSFKVWQPPCLDAHTKLSDLTTDSSWFRVTTQNCDTDDEISETKLENKSNGYVATVFLPKPSQLTSDFIPLQAGANQLQMDVELESGEKYHYMWTVSRQPATAAPTASN